MKATAIAPSNIAFIKYWGKADKKLRLPLNSSLSMNLSGAFTTTTVEFSPKYKKDSVHFLPDSFDKILLKQNFVKSSEIEEQRIIEHLNRIRKQTGILHKATVVTQNSFPKGVGVASSASGFAALTVAGFAAAGAVMSEKELTIFARLGSGSACRSVPDGFVVWEKGSTSEDSVAHSLYPHIYWDLRDIVVIVDSRMKKVSTTDGMENVTTSPYLSERLANVDKRLTKIKTALSEKNFPSLGELIEEDSLDMHHVMQTQNPPLNYWLGSTKVIMEAVRIWRNDGVSVYFTIDAGPNVHLICEGKDEQEVVRRVRALGGVESIIVNKPAPGTHSIGTHLF